MMCWARLILLLPRWWCWPLLTVASGGLTSRAAEQPTSPCETATRSPRLLTRKAGQGRTEDLRRPAGPLLIGRLPLAPPPPLSLVDLAAAVEACLLGLEGFDGFFGVDFALATAWLGKKPGSHKLADETGNDSCTPGQSSHLPATICQIRFHAPFLYVLISEFAR